MTKLCADAIGLVVNHVSHYEDGPEAEDEGMLETAAGFSYDPLRDDAQCMALVKKFRLGISGVISKSWHVSFLNPLSYYLVHANLNRAIVECVAKMQAAK